VERARSAYDIRPPSPAPKCAPVLSRDAVIAVIVLLHRRVTSMAPCCVQIQPMVGRSSPLTPQVAIHAVESQAKG
jgi:hypothetical protein